MPFDDRRASLTCAGKCARAHPVQYQYHVPCARVPCNQMMRAVAVGFVVATATARPTNLNDDSNEAIAIVEASPFSAQWAATPGNVAPLPPPGKP